MKAFIGKYNAHAGQRKQTDILNIEFLESDWPRVAKALGYNTSPACKSAPVYMVVDQSGITLRPSPGGVHFSVKTGQARKDGGRREARVSIQRATAQIAGIKYLPEFSLGEVEVVLDEANRQVFIPLVAKEDRRPPRKMNRGSKRTVKSVGEAAPAMAVSYRPAQDLLSDLLPAPLPPLTPKGRGLLPSTKEPALRVLIEFDDGSLAGVYGMSLAERALLLGDLQQRGHRVEIER